MAKCECSDSFINIIHQFHDGMIARVLDNGEASSDFPVSNGVKQGCVLVPKQFITMSSAMLLDAFNKEDPGVNVRYRTDGKLFKIFKD